MNENRHQIHRDYEVFKAKHAITLQNALQNAKTATQARENEAAAFALNLEKLVEADKASSQKLQALALEHKECQLQMKQMTQFQCELQSELREALEDKNRCEMSVLELESQYTITFKVRRHRAQFKLNRTTTAIHFIIIYGWYCRHAQGLYIHLSHEFILYIDCTCVYFLSANILNIISYYIQYANVLRVRVTMLIPCVIK